MAYPRVSALQSLLGCRTSLLRTQQRRWAQVHDVRFLATHRDPNQVLDRYRSKLDQKAKEEGHENVESLKDAYKDKIDNLRTKASTPLTPEPPSNTPSKPSTPPLGSAPPPPPQAQEQSFTKSTKAATGIPDKSSTAIKPLSSYLDVEKILALPPKEIESLWRLRHANSGTSICAAVPVETYQRIVSAARQNPQFILPLPRNSTPAADAEAGADAQEQGGSDIHFLQWAFHPAAEPATSGPMATSHTSTIIFTNLAAFKMHGSFSQPHTVVTHYLDLADEKGLVLLHGQVMPDAGVSTTEATWLVSCVQRFYDFGGQAGGRKGELLRMFTAGDVEGFKIEDLLAEAEKL